MVLPNVPGAMSGNTFAGPVTDITVVASPFTWANPEMNRVAVYLAGGTLSLVEILPNGGAALSVGLGTSPQFLNPGWSIKVTYVVPPTMKYTPL